jgi:molecular chaperone HscB
MDRIKCGGCGAEGEGGERCAECGRLLPFPPGADHWGVLGLPRRLALDRAEIERRVHLLNRRFHPDYYRLRSPEEQAQSLDNSAAVNTASRVLRDPVSRVEYLLGQEGVALDAKGAGRPPADLFEEIMELQEARQELAAAAPDEAAPLRARLEAARQELAGRRAAAEAELVARFPRWDGGDEATRRRLAGELRDLLGRRKYLRTVLRDLGEALDDPTPDEAPAGEVT